MHISTYKEIKYIHVRVGEETQWQEYLLCKSENLCSLMSKARLYDLCMQAQCCGWAETAESLGLIGRYPCSGHTERHCLKIYKLE